MSAAESPWSDTAIPFRVSTLERNETRTSDKIAKVDDEVEGLKVSMAETTQQVVGLASSMTRLQSSLDRVFWALIGLLVTIAGAGALTALHLTPS